jgi:hypothetical protein
MMVRPFRRSTSPESPETRTAEMPSTALGSEVLIPFPHALVNVVFHQPLDPAQLVREKPRL